MSLTNADCHSNWRAFRLFGSTRLQVFKSVLRVPFCDVWYTIGSPMYDRWITLATRIFRKPQVVHWAGTDILVAKEKPWLQHIACLPCYTHLAEADSTIRELAAMGIDARIAPIPPRLTTAEIPPLPETFTLLLYVRPSRPSFYGAVEYARLVNAFAHEPVRFIIVGGGVVDVPSSGKVVNLGWMESLKQAYEQASMLVRYTEHDGLSLMVLEALQAGRQVLWTHPFPHTTQVNDYSSLEIAVRDAYERHCRGELLLNIEGAAHVRANYNASRCMNTIMGHWEDATARKIR